MDKRSQKALTEAKGYAARQNWTSAVEAYDALLDRSPNFLDGYFLRAAMHRELGNHAATEADYETALTRSPDYYPYAWHLLALAEYQQEKYAEAEEHASKAVAVLTKARQQKQAEALRQRAKIAQQLYKSPVDFSPVPLNENINTPALEYLPTFTADEELLIYTVRDPYSQEKEQEDFYFSQKNEAREWIKGTPLSRINTELNEGAQTIAGDGKLLFFSGCFRPGSHGGCDLYYSTFEGGEWQTARQPRPPLNSAHWDSQPCLSANGRYLYFSSDRPDGLGGSDIWRSTRQANGSWGAPENLGAPINTPNDDESPYIHP
ncbi:MAG: hypothetical protein AAGJ82_03900, partial [Bacteroidota bacterium]